MRHCLANDSAITVPSSLLSFVEMFAKDKTTSTCNSPHKIDSTFPTHPAGISYHCLPILSFETRSTDSQTLAALLSTFRAKRPDPDQSRSSKALEVAPRSPGWWRTGRHVKGRSLGSTIGDRSGSRFSPSGRRPDCNGPGEDEGRVPFMSLHACYHDRGCGCDGKSSVREGGTRVLPRPSCRPGRPPHTQTQWS